MEVFVRVRKMKNIVVNCFVITMCFLYSSFFISGSPGGLFLYVTPIESSFNGKDYIDNYFKKHYGVDNELAPSCEIPGATKMVGIRSAVDVYYLKTKIQGVDGDLLKDSINNNKAKAKLRKILVSYQDDIILNGFDAILFYREIDHVVYFYGLSAIYKPEPLQKSSIAVGDLADENKLGQALCLALADLPTPAP